MHTDVHLCDSPVARSKRVRKAFKQISKAIYSMCNGMKALNAAKAHKENQLYTLRADWYTETWQALISASLQLRYAQAILLNLPVTQDDIVDEYFDGYKARHGLNVIPFRRKGA